MSKDRINATLKRRTDEWVAAGRWTHVNGNPFSAVAGDVLVDIRVHGDDAAQERVLAKNVNWSTVAYYRVSELGPPSTTQLLTEEHDDAVLDATKVNIMGDWLVESRPAAVKTLMSLGYRYEGGEMWVPPIGKAPPFSAPDLLDAAAGHMRDRAATYDKPEGERSMGKTVQAFNAITGRSMDVTNNIQRMLVTLKAVFETRGDDPVAVEMIDGLLVYAKDIKPVLRESDGWLLMAVLKMVRSEQRHAAHRDSIEDLIAYAALFGEARVGGQ